MSSSPSPRGGAAGPSNAAAGIELALVSGTSPTARVVFTPAVPPTRAMIGSGPAADWCVTARGVDAQHAEIAWDGATLWVRNAGSPRGTYVGIERIDDWRALEAGSEVGMGDARLVAKIAGASGEALAPGAEEIDPSDPSVPAHIAVAAMRGAYDPTRMAASIDAGPRPSVPPPASSRPMSQPSRAPGPPPRAPGPGSRAAGPPPRAPGPPLRAPGPPPRAGSPGFSDNENSASVTAPRTAVHEPPVAPQPAPSPRPRQPTGPRPLPRAPSTGDAEKPAVETQDNAGPLGGDSTVITSHPPYTSGGDTSTATNPHVPGAHAAAPAPVHRAPVAANVPPARMGGAHPGDDPSDFISDEATVAINSSSDGSLSVGGIGGPGSMPVPFAQNAAPPAGNPFAQALSASNSTPSPFGRAPTVTGVPANGRNSYPGGNPAFGHIPSGQMNAVSSSGSGASSASNRGSSTLSVFGAIPPAGQQSGTPAAQAFATLPRRTQIMLAITAAAALVLLGILLGRGGSEAPAPTVQSLASNDPAPTGPPPTPPIEGPAASPTGTLLGATIAPPVAPIDPRHPPPPGVPLSAVPERIAADAVIQGRLREAISLYQALAIAHTETPVYNQIATILRRKVEAQQQPCAPGSATPCGTHAAQPPPH